MAVTGHAYYAGSNVGTTPRADGAIIRFVVLRLGFAFICGSLLSGLLVTGCSNPTPKTATAPQTASQAALPSGWTLQTLEWFEIAVPPSWLGVDLSSDTLQTMIDKWSTTNPQIAKAIEAAKKQQAVKFSAMETTGTPFAANVVVSQDMRSASLDQYFSLLKTQLDSLGYKVLSNDQFKLNGDNAIKIQWDAPYKNADGSVFHVVQTMVAVDHEVYRYIIALTCLPQDADKYASTFGTIIDSFRVIK